MKAISQIAILALLFSASTQQTPQCQVVDSFDQNVNTYVYVGENLSMNLNEIFYGSNLSFSYSSNPTIGGIKINPGSELVSNSNPNLTNNVVTQTIYESINQNLTVSVLSFNQDSNYTISTLSTANQDSLDGQWTNIQLKLNSSLIKCLGYTYLPVNGLYAVTCYDIPTKETLNSSYIFIYNVSDGTTIPIYDYTSQPNDTISLNMPTELISASLLIDNGTNQTTQYILNLVPYQSFPAPPDSNYIYVYEWNGDNLTRSVINAQMINSTQNTVNITTLNVTQMQVVGNTVYLLDQNIGLIIFDFNGTGPVAGSGFVVNQANLTGFGVNVYGFHNMAQNYQYAYMAASDNQYLYIGVYSPLSPGGIYITNTLKLPTTVTSPITIQINSEYAIVNLNSNIYVYQANNQNQYLQTAVLNSTAVYFLYSNRFLTMNGSYFSFYFLSVPTITFQAQNILQTTELTIIADPFEGKPCSVQINLEYINDLTQVYQYSKNTIGNISTNASINLDDYYTGADLQFSVSSPQESIITPVLNQPFQQYSPSMLNAQLQDVANLSYAASVINSDNQNQFTIYQFFNNATYTYQNCNSSNTSQMNSAWNCSFVSNPVTLNATLFNQVETSRITFLNSTLNSSQFICYMEYNNSQACNSQNQSNNVTYVTSQFFCFFSITVNSFNNYSVNGYCNENNSYSGSISVDDFMKWNITGVNEYIPTQIIQMKQQQLIQFTTFSVILQFNPVTQQNVLIYSTTGLTNNTQIFVYGSTVFQASNTTLIQYNTQNLPNVPQQNQYNITGSFGYTIAGNATWTYSPSGLVYVVGQLTPSSNSLLVFSINQPELTTLYATSLIDSESITVFPLVTNQADFLMTNLSLTENGSEMTLYSIPFQTNLNFVVNQTAINSIVINTNFNLSASSMNKNKQTTNFPTRIVFPQYLTYLVINTDVLQLDLAKKLTIANDALTTIPLINNGWFNGNMLGYEKICPPNDTACTQGIQLQNQLEPVEVNFTQYYNATTNNQIVGITQNGNQLYILLKTISDSTSQQYAVILQDASNYGQMANLSTIAFTFEVNITGSISNNCGSLQYFTGAILSNTSTMGSLYLTCSQTTINSTSTTIYQAGMNSSANSTKWDWNYSKFLLFKTYLATFDFSVMDSQLWVNPYNESQIIWSALEGGNLNSYDVSQLNGSVLTHLSTFSQSQFFPNLQTSEYMSQFTAKPVQGNLSILALTNDLDMVYVTLNINNITYITINSTSQVWNLYDVSLNANYVVNQNSTVSYFQWVNLTNSSLISNFIVGVQGFPVYEFTLNATISNNVSQMYSSSYKNYGDQTLINLQFGGMNNEWLMGSYIEANSTNISFALWNCQQPGLNEIVSGYVTNNTTTGTFWWVNQPTSSTTSKYGIMYQPINETQGALWLQQYNQAQLTVNSLAINSNFTLGFQSAFIQAGNPSTVILNVTELIPPPSPSDDDKKFPTWAIIVICVVGVLLIGGIVGYCIKKRKSTGGYNELSGLKEPMKA